MGAGGVKVARPGILQAGGGASPTPALQDYRPKEIRVRPIPHSVAGQICRAHHYLGTYPGGAALAFGIFVCDKLAGIAVLGVGPPNGHRLLRDARREQVLCLARFWLDDLLPRNSESRSLAVILRYLRKRQSTVKTVVAYSDPSAGHTGGIYRACGFLYLGLSDSTPLYKLSDGSVQHSRTLGHRYGSRSQKYLASQGLEVSLVPQTPKHTYAALVDPNWRSRLKVQVLPYPKPNTDRS